jgi:hypothetical protein
VKRNEILIQGQVATFAVYRSDSDATAVTMYLKNDETGDIVVSSTGTYEYDSQYDHYIALVDFDSTATAVVGAYSAQMNETVPNGVVKYRGRDCRSGKFIICESLDGGIS